jgi:hypothetical protein
MASDLRAINRSTVLNAALRRLESLPNGACLPSRRRLAAMLLDDVPLSLTTIRLHLNALHFPQGWSHQSLSSLPKRGADPPVRMETRGR